jgi:HlyD family secretion protein
VQNVTTYVTVIEVPNPDLALKPGMTASVTIDVARRDRVLRVAAAALRFTPTSEVFAALGQAVPPEAARARGVRTSASAAPNAGHQAQPAARSEGATADWRDAPSIDAVFAPLEVPSHPARVWTMRDGLLVPLSIDVGLSDGIHVEVTGGVQAGTELVTGVTASSSASASATGTQSRSPLLPQFPRRSSGANTGRGR